MAVMTRVRPVLSPVIRRGRVPGRIIAAAQLGPGGNAVVDPYYGGSNWTIGGTSAQRPIVGASQLGPGWAWPSISGYLQWPGTLAPPYSIEMVLVPTSLAVGYKGILRGGAGSGAAGTSPAVYLGGTSNGSQWNLYNGGDVFAPTAAVLNTPHHLVVDYLATGQALAVNGLQVASNASVVSSTTAIRFGVDAFGNPTFVGHFLHFVLHGQAMVPHAADLHADWWARNRPDVPALLATTAAAAKHYLSLLGCGT